MGYILRVCENGAIFARATSDFVEILLWPDSLLCEQRTARGRPDLNEPILDLTTLIILNSRSTLHCAQDECFPLLSKTDYFLAKCNLFQTSAIYHLENELPRGHYTREIFSCTTFACIRKI